MNPGSLKMDSTLTTMWVSFFTAAGIPSDVGATYALTFAENRIQNDMLLDLNKEYLRDMGITRMGDVIAILRHAKQVHESTARERVLSSTINKVPVAAVTGRATITQPSSPASRILEHYTRNPSKSKEPSPVHTHKRKSNDTEFSSSGDVDSVKKARLIRFGTPPQTTVKEAPAAKQTVFARLGSTETVAVASKITTVPKQETKPVFARLGSKSKEDIDTVIPVPKDALKYEGILKSNPSSTIHQVTSVKKVMTVTTNKNNIRKIACTMRADETPVPVKEKLALPIARSKTLPEINKNKSVKFSNTIHYQEIEANKGGNANGKKKFSTVFNKPERRLSMPETSSSVKQRLGAKKPNNVTITKNIFNRLGV